jgi:hypothetical protein
MSMTLLSALQTRADDACGLNRPTQQHGAKAIAYASSALVVQLVHLPAELMDEEMLRDQLEEYGTLESLNEESAGRYVATFADAEAAATAVAAEAEAAAAAEEKFDPPQPRRSFSAPGDLTPSAAARRSYEAKSVGSASERSELSSKSGSCMSGGSSGKKTLKRVNTTPITPGTGRRIISFGGMDDPASSAPVRGPAPSRTPRTPHARAARCRCAHITRRTAGWSACLSAAPSSACPFAAAVGASQERTSRYLLPGGRDPFAPGWDADVEVSDAETEADDVKRDSVRFSLTVDGCAYVDATCVLLNETPGEFTTLRLPSAAPIHPRHAAIACVLDAADARTAPPTPMSAWAARPAHVASPGGAASAADAACAGRSLTLEVAGFTVAFDAQGDAAAWQRAEEDPAVHELVAEPSGGVELVAVRVMRCQA